MHRLLVLFIRGESVTTSVSALLSFKVTHTHTHLVTRSLQPVANKPPVRAFHALNQNFPRIKLATNFSYAYNGKASFTNTSTCF